MSVFSYFCRIMKFYNRWVRYWLFAGVVLVFVQIILGGVTRLTGSGLSITKWDIVIGTIPPLNEEDWIIELNHYKETPQYKKINKGMDLREFKLIFFWEYFHRLWARMMGFIFLIPFLFFVYKGWLDKYLYRRLAMVILLAVLAAVMGWVMVASGLINRPWVSAYKLAIHLTIAVTLFAVLLNTWINSSLDMRSIEADKKGKLLIKLFLVFVFVQVFFGGVLAGIKGALVHPTWPTISGEMIPNEVMSPSQWNVDKFVNYEDYSFLATLIHFVHRNIAYVLLILGIWIFAKFRKEVEDIRFRMTNILLLTVLLVQLALGVIVVLNSKGSIPLFFGVIHQAMAIVLLGIILYMNERVNNKRYI